MLEAARVFLSVLCLLPPPLALFLIFHNGHSRSARWTSKMQLSAASAWTESHWLLTHLVASLLRHRRIKNIRLSNKRSDVILALGVTQRVSDLWKCHHIDFIQMFIHHSVYREKGVLHSASNGWDLLWRHSQFWIGNCNQHLTVKSMPSHWFPSAWDLICYS